MCNTIIVNNVDIQFVLSFNMFNKYAESCNIFINTKSVLKFNVGYRWYSQSHITCMASYEPFVHSSYRKLFSS